MATNANVLQNKLDKKLSAEAGTLNAKEVGILKKADFNNADVKNELSKAKIYLASNDGGFGTQFKMDYILKGIRHMNYTAGDSGISQGNIKFDRKCADNKVRNFTIGAWSEAAAWIQAFLKSQGYNLGKWDVDGHIGSTTIGAINTYTDKQELEFYKKQVDDLRKTVTTGGSADLGGIDIKEIKYDIMKNIKAIRLDWLSGYVWTNKTVIDGGKMFGIITADYKLNETITSIDEAKKTLLIQYGSKDFMAKHEIPLAKILKDETGKINKDAFFTEVTVAIGNLNGQHKKENARKEKLAEQTKLNDVLAQRADMINEYKELISSAPTTAYMCQEKIDALSGKKGLRWRNFDLDKTLDTLKGKYTDAEFTQLKQILNKDQKEFATKSYEYQKLKADMLFNTSKLNNNPLSSAVEVSKMAELKTEVEKLKQIKSTIEGYNVVVYGNQETKDLALQKVVNKIATTEKRIDFLQLKELAANRMQAYEDFANATNSDEERKIVGKHKNKSQYKVNNLDITNFKKLFSIFKAKVLDQTIKDTYTAFGDAATWNSIKTKIASIESVYTSN